MTNEKKILIIEDDSLLQEFYKILFRKLKMSFEILEDGEEIISQTADGKICLIIMDINLRNTYLDSKKIDGAQLSKYIKEKFFNLNIPILLVTAYSPNVCGDDLLVQSKADDLILKPIINYDSFIDKVRRLLKIDKG